ncbi:hypothetical protein ACVIHI_004031 [Bradyrhizobium sp. USDA 4524]|nr:hypothetical protein [Bradyrhizobium sp. USDA 4538]MCP1903615.1 hypothetical protein [Bradyrhizobium sp. USDA 4537]MCP1990728.1 hypothetical protein [Bradyrhizobium sp. USDA 4539]
MTTTVWSSPLSPLGSNKYSFNFRTMTDRIVNPVPREKSFLPPGISAHQ